MTEKESKKFEMQMDDESQDFQIQEGIDDSKVEKLNKRVTRISIIIPCLVIIIILAAYFDLKKNLSSMNTMGNMGVQSLSKELESRFSSLSIKEADLEENTGKKIGNLEKAIASLQADTKEAVTAIKYIRSARKSDNSNTENAINTIEKKLDSIPKDLNKISSDMKKMEQSFTEKLTHISQFIASSKNDLQKINSDISSLKSSKVDRTALNDQQKVYQLALRQLTSNLEERISSLENTVKKLEKIKTPAKKQSKAKPKSDLSSTQTQTESSPNAQSSPKTDIPKPGTIIEQDLPQKRLN
jgi:DNA repair exonuclease SbcCD ATPase subunit